MDMQQNLITENFQLKMIQVQLKAITRCKSPKNSKIPQDALENDNERVIILIIPNEKTLEFNSALNESKRIYTRNSTTKKN